MTREAEEPVFDTPMKQAPEGLWLEAAHDFRETYKALGLLALYAFVKQPFSWWVMMVMFVGLSGIIFFLSWLKYKSVRFYVDDKKRAFIYDSGVLNKKHIVMQLDRIQQVNITQHLLQRMLKVYKVEISTAGSEKTEVVIRAISLKAAQALRKRLLSESSADREVPGTIREDTHFETETVSEGEKDILRLSNATILKVAITSRYMKSLWILIAFWVAAYNNLKDILNINSSASDEVAELLIVKYLLHSTIGIILVFILLWVLFNILNGFLKFYNYQIRFKESALQVTFSAIKANQVIVRDDKVQVVEMITNYFQKKMNLSRLVFQQASSNFRSDRKAVVEIPGVSEAEKREAVTRVLGTFPEDFEITLYPDYRKLFKPIALFILLPLSIIWIFSIEMPFLFGWIACWITAVGISGYFRFRHSKMMIGKDFIMVQEGVFDVRKTVVKSYKIQGIGVTQRLWHRRAGIAHVILYTAASNVVFRYARLSEINPYLNRWLYDAESTDKKWM